eukprot:gene14873-34760_t
MQRFASLSSARVLTCTLAALATLAAGRTMGGSKGKFEDCDYQGCGSDCKGSKCAKYCDEWNCGERCDGYTCAFECTGKRCGAECTGYSCARGCVGDQCAQDCHDVFCAIYCRGDDCGQRCVGVECATACEGKGCGAQCLGRDCAMDCKGEWCGKGANTLDAPCSEYTLEWHCNWKNANHQCKWAADGVCIDSGTTGGNANPAVTNEISEDGGAPASDEASRDEL